MPAPPDNEFEATQLESVGSDLAQEDTSASDHEHPDRRRRAPRRTIVGLTLAAILVLGGGALLLSTTQGESTSSSTVVSDGGRADAEGFVVPLAELRAKPTSGEGWQLVKSAADRSSYGVVDLGDRDSLTQSYVLAAALVYARTGDTTYRDRVISHVRQVCGTQTDGPHDLLAVARTLFGYVAAAEIVDMDHATTCHNGQTWRNFLETIRTEPIDGHGRWQTLEFTSADTSNNWGAYALSSHLAVSIALDDTDAIQRDINIFRRFLGDTTSPASPFNPTSAYTSDDNGAGWDMAPTLTTGINPASPGDPRSGALIEDALRGSDAPSVPCCTVDDAGITYQEETLDALVTITQLLRTHGTDLRNTADQALRRAYEYMITNGGPGPYSLTRYLPYAINHLYDTNHPTQPEDRPYRHLGYGTWLFTN